jgi:hypothetical protein
MGLFTRRRPAAVAAGACWQPSGSGVATAPGYQATDDEGCAVEHAYGVTFTLDGAPAATIRAWFYVIYADLDDLGDFQVGWRCDYVFGGGPTTSAPWVHTAYGMDDPEFYDDLDHAEATARSMAEALASTPRTGPSDDDPSFLDWDGQPWR